MLDLPPYIHYFMLIPQAYIQIYNLSPSLFIQLFDLPLFHITRIKLVYGFFFTDSLTPLVRFNANHRERIGNKIIKIGIAA